MSDIARLAPPWTAAPRDAAVLRACFENAFGEQWIALAMGSDDEHDCAAKPCVRSRCPRMIAECYRAGTSRS